MWEESFGRAETGRKRRRAGLTEDEEDGEEAKAEKDAERGRGGGYGGGEA